MTTTTTTLRLAMVAMLAGVMTGLPGCAADLQSAAKMGRAGKTSGSSASSSAKASATRWNSNTDPCAMRLHDVCAPMLLYFGRYQTLPARIEELAQVPGVSVPELACPTSGQPYVYNPQGPPGLEAGTRIILHDATPAHDGRRWGIVVREPAPGQALVVNVIAVPEAVFSKPSR
jgi:hypothetical protein